MSKLRAKLLTAEEHAEASEALAAWEPQTEADTDVADLLQNVADKVEARKQASPADLTDVQRRLLALHFVQSYSKYDGLAWVAENEPRTIADAAEACAALQLTGTQRVLEELMALFGGAAKMRDDAAMLAMWKADDGDLAEKIEPLEEQFFELETSEPLVKTQLELIAKNPKDFMDA